MASWGQANYIGSVNFDDVMYVLARSKGISRPRVLWLRKRIWWGLNDRYRSCQDGLPIPMYRFGRRLWNGLTWRLS